jgi:hypothetical protein
VDRERGIPEISQIDGTIEPMAGSNANNGGGNNDYYNYVTQSNGAVIRFVVRDTDTDTDKIIVIFPLLSGVTDVDATISADGLSLNLSHAWPTICYSSIELFRCILNDPALPNYHPNIVGMNSELKHFQWCYSAGTHRNAVPVQIYFGVRRSGSFM